MKHINKSIYKIYNIGSLRVSYSRVGKGICIKIFGSILSIYFDLELSQGWNKCD